MKRIFLLIIIPIFLFTLIGCGEKPASKAQDSSNKYLEKLFTFKDTDKIIDEQSKQKLMNEFIERFKPYMTENGYNNHIVIRDLFFTYNAAWANQCNISVSNIKTILDKENKEDNYYIFDYSLDITATPLNGDKETKYPVKGEITVKQDGRKFLIEDYNYTDAKEWEKFALNF
jgi:hypothetical protein